MPLTEIQIKNAKPQEKPYKLTDGNGLYLLINPKGKYWRYDYRIYGKRKTLAIGIYPVTTLANAREKHLAARRLLAQEPPIDPSEYKKQQRTEQKKVVENAFENIAREWLVHYRPSVNSTHHERTMRRLEVYLFPWIGKDEISTLTPPDILKPIKLIQEQNKLETAHRVLQVTSQIFRYAVRTGRADRDITADLRGAIPSGRTRHMASMTEPEDVAQLMKAIQGFKGSLTVQIALKLAPLVFVRPGELRRARWADIDLDAKEWRYMVTKTKTEHLVPLSTQAVELLKTIHPISGRGEWVFRGGHDPRKPMSEAAINAALKRMGYNTQTEITGHGFRAMARTILHERLNFDPYVIEHQLAHKVPDALGAAYNRTKFIEQRKDMMQKWSDYLQSTIIR
ncbi:tyrosine-type recombinase/integrase [Methylovorus menthalis]|uniref:tyrosine-type recombinase/integrase n=1 Tax=Methylovorus menthalis TaxID=1002227 RepID=UPI001E5DCBC5|nr:integrase arm-type DNA-binding domain-containing protein [Methylovorus menthalis]MCB4810590.1 tyrosine-type recombinase/integrase [Methylovorus menthalis]